MPHLRRPLLYLSCIIALASAACSPERTPVDHSKSASMLTRKAQWAGNYKKITNANGSVTITTQSDCAVLDLSTKNLQAWPSTSPSVSAATYDYSFCLSKLDGEKEGRVILQSDGTLELEQGELFIASKLSLDPARLHTTVVTYFYPLVKAKKVSAGSTLTEWIFSLEPAVTRGRGASAVVQLRLPPGEVCDESSKPPCGVVAGHEDHISSRVLHRAVGDGKVVYGEVSGSAFGKEDLDAPAIRRSDRFKRLEDTAHNYGVKD